MMDDSAASSILELIEDEAAWPAAPVAHEPYVGRERRLHVRAYDYWVSLLAGRPMPAIGDLDPIRLADFAPASMLIALDTGGAPTLRYLGDRLRLDAGVGPGALALTDLAEGTLAWQLARRLPEISGHRAPVGFEAEFTSRRGEHVLYRGMLLPFSDDAPRPDRRGEVDFVYGVISWKVTVATHMPVDVQAAVESALAATPRPRPVMAWGDGPGATRREAPAADAGLDGQLAEAQAVARRLAGDRQRGEQALHRALGLAHDFSLAGDVRADEFAALLAQAGVRMGAGGAPAAVIRLIFGATLPTAERTRYTAALVHARRLGLGVGTLCPHLDGQAGGVAGMVAAERRARAATKAQPDPALLAERLRAVPALASLTLGPVDADYLLLLGRREADGGVGVLGRVPGDKGMTKRVLGRFLED